MARRSMEEPGSGAGADTPILVPRLWPMIGILATPVLIGAGVFLRRYRGADRTAMVLAVLVGIGVCLLLALVRFQLRFGGKAVRRETLRWIGFRSGAAAGAFAGGVGVVLLAARWAIDQLGGPVGEQFLPAFLRALLALWWATLSGLPAYLSAGVVVGAMVGLGVAEAIGACAKRARSDAGADE